jgi:hypothetical protein
MAIAGLQIGQNEQRKLFDNLDMVKISIPQICYNSIVSFLFTAKMNAMNKIKADRHIVTSRLRNSIYVLSHSKDLKDKDNYEDDLGNVFRGVLDNVHIEQQEAAFGTNVEYAEKIERLDSFIYWGFKNADDKEFSKQYNREVNQLKSKLKK